MTIKRCQFWSELEHFDSLGYWENAASVCHDTTCSESEWNIYKVKSNCSKLKLFCLYFGKTDEACARETQTMEMQKVSN